MDREVSLYDKIKRDQLRGTARTNANHHHNQNNPRNSNSLISGLDSSAGTGAGASAGTGPGASPGTSASPISSGYVLGSGSGYGVKPRPLRTYDFNFTEADAWVVSEGEYIDEDERRWVTSFVCLFVYLFELLHPQLFPVGLVIFATSVVDDDD